MPGWKYIVMFLCCFLNEIKLTLPKTWCNFDYKLIKSEFKKLFQCYATRESFSYFLYQFVSFWHYIPARSKPYLN